MILYFVVNKHNFIKLLALLKQLALHLIINHKNLFCIILY